MPILEIVKTLGGLGISLAATQGAEEALKWSGMATLGITSAIAAVLSGTVLYAVLTTLLGLQYKFAIECIDFNDKFLEENLESMKLD